jgi:hypothetical protein
VPEADVVHAGNEHPGRDALAATRDRVGGDLLEQGQLHLHRRHRDSLEQLPGRGRQSGGACEDGVADGGGELVAARHCFAHEEGVAGGLAVQLVGVRVVQGGDGAHGLE